MNEYRLTPYLVWHRGRLSSWIDCEFNRLVATEHLRSKYSLLESFHTVFSHAAYLAQALKFAVLTSIYCRQSNYSLMKVDLYKRKNE